MINNITARKAFYIAFALLFICLFINSGYAQGPYRNSTVTDGSTPLAIAPGAPAGSYALSGFDNVSLYSGSLNFSLPLLSIGGRGEAGYTMTLPIEQKWRIRRLYFGTPTSSTTMYDVYYADPKWWTGLKPGFGAGVLQGRRSGDIVYVSGQLPGSWSRRCQTLTRLTFTSPNGSEMELRDAGTDGAPFNSSDDESQRPSRGTTFVSRDGSSTTFISDSQIKDALCLELEHPDTMGVVTNISGYLMFSSGVRYRIDQGQVTWIRDRNGNELKFIYSQNVLHKIKDSSGREVTINKVSDSLTEITYKGFAGQQRKIQLYYTNLGAALPDMETPKTYGQLFPEILSSGNFGNSGDTFDGQARVVSEVRLLDGRSYKFTYNTYGELTRVKLPTGGAYDYSYENSSGVYQGGKDYFVFRRIKKRSVYVDATSPIPDSKATYDYSETPSSDQYFAGTTTTVQAFDKDGALVSRSDHLFYGEALQSLFLSNGLSYPKWTEGREYQTKLYDTDGTTVLRQIDNSWMQRTPAGGWTGPSDARPNDSQIVETITTFTDTNQVSKSSAIDPYKAPTDPTRVGFDQFSNRTDVWEYDFGPGGAGALIRHSHTDYANAANLINGIDYTTTAIHLRNLPVKQQVLDAVGTEKARTTYEYDNYVSDAKHASLIGYSDISGLCTTAESSGPCVDITNLASYKSRGNATAVTPWLLPNTPLPTYRQYDIAGNVVKVIDGRGFETTVDFSDCFGAPDNDAEVKSSPAELTAQSKQSYAFPTKVTNALDHITYSQYDYYTGKPVNVKDVNEVVSSASYDDELERLTQSIRAIGTNQKSQTTIDYNDANLTITVTTDLKDYGDNRLKSQTIYDGLGRITESRSYESATSYISTTQEYDGLGRAYRATNPYRAGDTIHWTTTSYDTLGRVASVTTPDNAVVKSAYRGDQTLVTDQAGKQRLSRTNSLGQLTEVWEITAADSYTEAITFPDHPEVTAGYRTQYEYDTLGNLKTVKQRAGTNGTLQTRSFTYDSLSRLKTAQNPESGVTAYEYDSNGNLSQKTDARTITTLYTYDALNRLTIKDYSDSTPDVTYAYDAASVPKSKGRLTSVSSSVSTYNYTGYDELGRVKGSSQVTDGHTYPMPLYKYNLAGGMTEQTYPSGRVVKTGYDDATRISSVKGEKVGEQNRTYAESFEYAASGSIKALKLGNELWERTRYNVRLQPEEIKLGTGSTDTDPASANRLKLTYSYGTANNNGNVLSQTISVPEVGSATSFTAVQSYTYDSLNRIKAMTEADGLSQTYEYDRWGNRAVTAGYVQAQTLTPTPQSLNSFSKDNNRIMSATYDDAGNLTSAVAGHTFAYDAEGRMKSHNVAESVGTIDNQYGYDGDGRRVKKLNGSVTTIFVYNVMGQMVAEYTDNNTSQTSGTSYFTADHLGTPRVITDGQKGVVSRHDYLPFGEEIQTQTGRRSTQQGYIADADGVRQKFTGKERDDESGLDYFGARFYASAQGRFTSCDPISRTKGHMVNPQRWNLYVYVINNPLALYDPNGRNDKGNGGGKAIDIFITFDRASRGPSNKDIDKNWDKLKKEGEKRGVKITVNYLGDANMTKKLLTALQNPNATVIIAGHNYADSASMAEFTNKTGKERNIGSYINMGDAIVGKDGVKFDGAKSYIPIPDIKADFAAFTCNIDGAVPAITSKMNSGTFFMYNDGGLDGLGSVDTSERAALAVAAAVLAGFENPESIRRFAQGEIDQGVNLVTPEGLKIYQQDRVQLIRR